MSANHRFREETKEALDNLLAQLQGRFRSQEYLKIDLHCHDHNSDIPDEPLGRILRLPETWLPTEHLLQTLHKNRMDVITITNHNNARTCWSLLEKGMDVLGGSGVQLHRSGF
jgi:hypothetical protein